MYTVVREIERPPREAVEALAGIATAVLSDTLGRFATMDAGIKPLADGMQVVGPAVTVKTYPADNLMIHLALKVARPGDVRLWDASTWRERTVLKHSGEVLSLSFAPKGTRLAAGGWDGAVKVWDVADGSGQPGR